MANVPPPFNPPPMSPPTKSGVSPIVWILLLVVALCLVMGVGRLVMCRSVVGQATEPAGCAITGSMIQKATLVVSKAAQLQVRVLDGQESFRIHPFAKANAWAVLPESDSELPAGTLLECYPLQSFPEWPCAPISA